MTQSGAEQELKREIRKLKKHLKDLTTTTSKYLACIDVLMERPESPKRGEEIARLSNALDYANDCALHFGLDFDLKKLDGRKEGLKRRVRQKPKQESA